MRVLQSREAGPGRVECCGMTDGRRTRRTLSGAEGEFRVGRQQLLRHGTPSIEHSPARVRGLIAGAAGVSNVGASPL